MVCDKDEKEDIYYFILHCTAYNEERSHSTHLHQPYIESDEDILGHFLFGKEDTKKRKNATWHMVGRQHQMKIIKMWDLNQKLPFSCAWWWWKFFEETKHNNIRREKSATLAQWGERSLSERTAQVIFPVRPDKTYTVFCWQECPYKMNTFRDYSVYLCI